MTSRWLVAMVVSATLAACTTSGATYSPWVTARMPEAASVMESGRSDVEVVATLELPVGTNGSVPVRVEFPREGSQLPVIVFSHGAYSSREFYPAVTAAWAAAGYVVISPTHVDSTNRLGRRGTAPDPAWWQARLDDMAAIAAQIDTLGRHIPALAGRVDGSRLVMAGHSFGGMVAQSVGGATWFDPDRNETVSSSVPGVDAVIILSGAGRLPPRTRDSDWQTMTVPTFVSVGTNDLKQTEISGMEWRREPYDLAPPGDKYLLTLEGADHYLGGMIGRDDLPKDPNGRRFVSAFDAASIAFLDAYVKGDARARRWLESQSKRERLDDEPLATLISK